jgi:hypothetical protein
MHRAESKRRQRHRFGVKDITPATRRWYSYIHKLTIFDIKGILFIYCRRTSLTPDKIWFLNRLIRSFSILHYAAFILTYKKGRLLMRRFLPSIVALVMFAGFSSGANIKTTTIETKILELPKVSLQTISYAGLSVGYALSDITVASTAKQSEEFICQNRATNKIVKTPGEYYNVTYTVPAVIIVAKDLSGKVVYAEKIGNQKFNNEPQTERADYGKNDCRFAIPGVLEQTFEKEKGDFLNKIKADAVKDSYKNATELVHKSLFAKYADEKFRISYVEDKSGACKDLSDAYDIAVAVFKDYKAKGYAPEVVEPLKKSIALWEKALAESNLSDKKARINYDVTLKLHENLAVAYMYTNDYETAMIHFGKISSLQKFSFPDLSDANWAKVHERDRKSTRLNSSH